jgi:hypothetical protein
MSIRLMCFALCGWLLATPAAAIVIVQDGDVYDELFVTDPDFLMTGGSVNELRLGSQTTAVIEGGVLGEHNSIAAIVTSNGNPITIRGGALRSSFAFPRFPGYISSAGGIPVLMVEGSYFRMKDHGLGENNLWEIQGWLSDGSFANFGFAHEGAASEVNIIFNIDSSDSPPGDTDGDWDVDISDLNTIRNNFGSEGPGDLDHSGTVDVGDLNQVRNNFAFGSDFTLDPSMEVPANAAAPEPSTLFLAMTILLLVPSYRAFRP